MTNDELSPTRHSGFAIDSLFGFRHSSFCFVIGRAFPKMFCNLVDAMNGITAHMPHGRPRRDQSHLTLKERACLNWARRQLRASTPNAGDHERRVLVIAGKLFDLLDDLHPLKAMHRRLLRKAALLHDVGRKFGEKNHPADGARMIEDDGYLPLESRERRAVMYLTRYHRGAVPRGGFDGILQRGDGRKSLRIVLALLRAADALDNRQLAAPAISITLRGNRLSITCFVDSDLKEARKAFKRRKKFRLLEALLDCKIEVDVRHAEVVEHV